MLRDKKEIEALRKLRTELMLEGSERAKMEKRAMQGSCCMWLLCGFFHGGHWLCLAAKAGEPRLAYLARSKNRTLDGASKKVETMIRTLEQHNDTVNPEDVDEQEQLEEDGRRRCIEIVSASGLRKADRYGKSDPYAKVWFNNEWIGQTDPVFKTLAPKWGRTFEIELPKGKGKGGGLMLVEVYDHDLGSCDFSLFFTVFHRFVTFSITFVTLPITFPSSCHFFHHFLFAGVTIFSGRSRSRSGPTRWEAERSLR